MASEMSDNPMDVSETIYQPQSNGDGKSWEELRTIVKGTRKTVTALACRVPSSFCFRSQMSQSGPTTRLYFLGIPPKQRESTLMYVNVPETPMNITPMLQWCPLFEGLENAGSAQMSKEEQLLRERKRLGVFGITSYEVTDDRGILFPACNTLFQCKDDLTKDEPLVPDKIDSDIEGSRMDPKICPTNSNLVAFVRNKDLWVVNTATQLETRLTTSNKGSEHLKEDPYSSGVPSFVVQEEFDRYTGYWWSPAEPCKDENGQQTYTILYEYVDESGVDIIPIYGPFEDKGVDEYRYPRPGKTNATSALQIIDFCITEDGNEIVSKRSLCDDYLMASYEYLVRAGWTPDGKYIHCQWLNRRQTNLALFVIPVNHFHPACSGGNEDRSVGPEKCHNSHRGYRMLEDESQIWVNVHDIIHFLPSTSDGTFEYIWLSERSGFRHLYRVTSQLPLGEESSVAGLNCDTEVVPITTGEWEVSTKDMWVDEDRELVYFMGLKDTPLETHLYVTSYKNPSKIARLTQAGFSHSVSFNKECSIFVSVYSSTNCAPMSTLYKVNVTDNGVATQPVGLLMPSTPCSDYIPPEMFNFKSKSGFTMYGMYYKPQGYQPGVKYPTVLFVYGGPHVQLVSNSFKGLKYLRLHTLATQGYAVVILDGRGSSCRGLKFESHIKNRLGTTEIEDQVEGLQWLMSNVDFIDEKRVAIHGWSYGGYLSLMGLAQRPDVFKVSIAGAPVVDWNLYDTGYTERYMDLPDHNDYGYRQGNVLTYVKNFPDQENRLLIIHGLMDENVHFSHSSLLVDALIKECKPHTLQVYPNERHGIRGHEAGEHYRTLVLNFLKHNL